MSVYFIQASKTKHIKIGTTRGSAKERMASLQTGSPVKLKLLAEIDGDARTEAALHRLFAADRVRGEWFNPSDDLLNYLERLDAPGATVNLCHRFFPSSGTTHTCTLCGCVRFEAYRKPFQYSTWKPKVRQWSGAVDVRDHEPECYSGRPVPEWIISASKKYDDAMRRNTPGNS